MPSESGCAGCTGGVEEECEVDDDRGLLGGGREKAAEEVVEEDPFDAAADAALAAARPRAGGGCCKWHSPPTRPSHAAPRDCTDRRLDQTLAIDTSMELFQYAERQAADQLSSASAVATKLARAHGALLARKASGVATTTADPACGVETTPGPAGAEVAVKAEAQPASLLPPPRMPRRMKPSHPSKGAASSIGGARPAARLTAARLAAVSALPSRAASDIGPITAKALVDDSRAEPSPPPGCGGRILSRQKEQEDLMMERKLEASLDRLDAKLAQRRLRRRDAEAPIGRGESQPQSAV
ncbi:hypothetical protein EMIHUDRAFT_239517 [Emiliania huxleyi CCMP1516]|uniref:Uncharacterized protein n=2 Tax=Emiliania huxleyi TaxID=2903 RepID=A0A0D3JJ44_EMIH1|nr:hypothetical protein EMIHUDRAFT_239517 [Emiliania huxleyi CCMP1516]EOD23529.1 hypothetical protein EMIHUDRAFT_239517 [Emiliania huxleyi CCMP1516]|eukprot:XP_005775958.1 hypothetical protein EMIHUDRAFT_239517 [Emiliania huxleyi CCMP1516]